MNWLIDNLQYILLGLLGVFFNVMDTITTEIGLHKLPDDIKVEEGNPIAVWGMKKNNLIFEILKQVYVVGVIGYYIYKHNIFGLIVVASLFGLVVLNNSVTLILRNKTRKRIPAPFHIMVTVLRIPKKLAFIFIVLVLFAVSIGIAVLITD